MADARPQNGSGATLIGALQRMLQEPGQRLPQSECGSADEALARTFNEVAERFDDLRARAEREAAMECSIEELKEALLSVAYGTFDRRVTRTNDGSPLDVIAFLVNSAADEVHQLVSELNEESNRLQLLQEQMVESEKLAALGRLAAGVAHEMNQPLTVITSLLSILDEDPDSSPEQRRYFGLMEAATSHIAQIVDSVRTFGRPSPFELRPTPAVEPVRRAEQLVLSDLQKLGVTINRNLPENLPPLRANADRLQQVFVNLLCNARDALEERGEGGEIWLDAWAATGEVVYEIRDNGPGIAAEQKERLFEPFFTTKASKGTGLGLSVSLAVVREHGGRLVHRDPGGGGSCFVVSIPTCKEVS